jgi:catechol 2,3-dioxygenase-like lactoylglutathione lyase family enzyme
MPTPDAPRIRNLDHVGIHVADVPASHAFYESVLGLDAIPRPDLGFPGAWLRIGTVQELHLIGRDPASDLPPRERHFALAVDSAAIWAERLRELEVPFEGPNSRPDGAAQIFLRDPDGHVIELLEPATG